MSQDISITCKPCGAWEAYTVEHDGYLYLPLDVVEAVDYAVSQLGAVEVIVFDDTRCVVR